MFLLYNCLLTVLAPIWLVWMLLRAKARKDSPNWSERQGQYLLSPRKDGPRVWIHAVSVGEVIAAMPILQELRNQAPDLEIVLSVTTSSGHQTARERASELFDHLVYVPIDVARFALSAMQRVQPDVLAIMETELWMNLLWAAKTFDARTLLINGRISDRSFRRSRWIAFFYKSLLGRMDRCLMQSARDAERIRRLGAKEVEVLGNSKFDQAAAGAVVDAAKLRRELGLPDDKPVIVVGSTRGAAEENLVLDAIAQVGLARLSVVHAPRHLETAPDLAERVAKRFGTVALRSEGETGPYLILDSYGELASVYAVADIAVVGGGFERLGGQNLIQPLAVGKPVLHGPYMGNFRDVASEAVACGASEIARSSDELASALTRLIADPEERHRWGEAAHKLVETNLGASARYAAAILAEIGQKKMRA